MAISTNGTVIARLAGGLYNTVMSNATYLEVASQDPSTLANTLYSRDFAKSTDLAVATTILANLGLASQAGLDAWVAAQLTAAGAANKGAKIVSLLNDFAGLSADATWGTYATAFNTKVDAALAASQKTGSVEAKFEAAGTVATTNATFTLTTGVDTGAAFTGGAGNDTFTANNAALGVLDSIDGGAGTDTLTITDSVSVPAFNITAVGIETLNVSSSAGSVGAVASDAAVATKQKVVYTFGSSEGTSVGAGPVKITYGGASQTIANSTVGNAVTLDNVVIAINELAGASVATTASSSATGSITITAPTAGVALPTIAFANGSYTPQGASSATANTTIDVTANTNYSFPVTLVSSQVAVDAVSSSTFSVPAGVTTVSATAATAANIASVSTAATTVIGTVVTVSSGTTQTVTATDSVRSSTATGAVDITTKVPATDIAAVTATGWTAAPGVFVRGGTTVKITETAGTSTSNATPAGNATAIQVGSNPASASGTAGVASGSLVGTSATGYPEKVGNLSSAPTGNVTTSTKTAYTDTLGYKNVKYGTGAVTAYMNGGTTADITGAGTVTVRDLQTIKLLSSATATAAPGTSTLSTVNLTGVSGAVGITSDAITTLSVLDTASQTITINSNTGKNNVALNVSVGNSSPTIAASEASSVAFTGITSAYEKVGSTLTTANSGSTTILQAAKATNVSFAGSSDQTLSTSSTLAAVTSITSTSTKKVTLGDVSAGTNASYLPKLSSIDASGASGALSVTIGAPGTSNGTGYGMNVKGGSGNDSVTLTAGISTASVVNVDGVTVSTSVSLGAGNDKLLNGGTAASSSATLSNTSTIDGGDGTDTISVSLVNSGNATAVKNFETLDLKGAAASGSFDASLLTNSTITGVAISGDIGSAGAYTVSGISGTALAASVSDTGTTAGSVTATLATSTGTADTATITYAATSSSATTSILTLFKTTGIESVSIASGGTLTLVADTITNTLATFQDTSNKTASITITGSNAFVLGAYTSATSYTDGVEQYTTAPTTAIADANTAAGLTKIDASAATGAVTIVAGETQSDVHAGDGTTNLIFTGLTITGGSGADKLVNLAAAGIVNGGDGADAITVIGAAAVVDGGAGADTITVNAAVSTTLTGGSGANTFNLTAATAASTTSPKLTTITDYKTTDTLVLGDATPFAKADISAATTLLGAYTAALLNIGGTYGGAWFVYGGNTYVCVDADDGGSFSTSDIIVKLTGVFDLSVLSGDASTGLIGLA